MASANPFAAVFTHYDFQLAALEPSASSTDPIRVSIGVEARSDTPYECISYDRSKDYGSVKILVDGEETEIPKPLESALRALRKADVPRLVWADVLLGVSPEQRSEQITRAKPILENAKTTIAWLGPGDDRTAEAFKIIETLAIWWHQAAATSGFPESFVQATADHMNGAMAYIASQDASQLQPNDEKLWEAVHSIFESEYFESVQAISDLVLSPQATVTSGSSSMPWTDFAPALSSVIIAMPRLLGTPSPPSLQEAFSRVQSIGTADRRYRQDPGVELLPMIQTAREAKCEDPREFVFSMLPLVRYSKRTPAASRFSQMPVVDYNKSPQEVFTEAAKFVIEDRQDLILWWAERPPHARKMQGMPSWVPDWATPLPPHAVKICPTASPSLREWSDTVEARKRITVTENKVHIQAHTLDRITSVSRIFTQDNCRRLLLETWQGLPTVLNQTLEQKIDTFWRTVVLNMGPVSDLRNDHPPPKEFWVSFQSVVAEERILELMECKPEDLLKPDIRARVLADEQCNILGPQTGKSEAYEALLRKNAIGRRFFTTETGRMGMTAFEEPPDMTGLDTAINGLPTDSDFGGLSEFLLDSFQEHLRGRDPRTAGIFEQIMQRREKARGAKVGDVIVAAVGGFSPYVLRPVGATGGEAASSTGKEYQFVGDCYLHGIMHGECFSQTDWLGRHSWKKGVAVEDIRIV